MCKVMKDDRAGERGYALVAVLALMTIIILMLMAAVPSARQQAQREREEEAIRRGEEVAEAIGRFLRYSGGRLPTSMRELLNGVPSGTKRIQVLRRSAARDPLTASGEWRLIGISDTALVSFQRSLIDYAGGGLPATGDPLVRPYAARLEGARHAAPAEVSDEAASDVEVSGERPFIGVASSSRSESIIHYYGLGRHDRWVFTPLYR